MLRHWTAFYISKTQFYKLQKLLLFEITPAKSYIIDDITSTQTVAWTFPAGIPTPSSQMWGLCKDDNHLLTADFSCPLSKVCSCRAWAKTYVKFMGRFVLMLLNVASLFFFLSQAVLRPVFKLITKSFYLQLQLEWQKQPNNHNDIFCTTDYKYYFGHRSWLTGVMWNLPQCVKFTTSKRTSGFNFFG